MSETSEFNVIDSRIQGLGRAWEELGRTGTWEHFGQMPFLVPPMTLMVSAGIEPRLDGCKSVALTTESRMEIVNVFFKVEAAWTRKLLKCQHDKSDKNVIKDVAVNLLPSPRVNEFRLIRLSSFAKIMP